MVTHTPVDVPSNHAARYHTGQLVNLHKEHRTFVGLDRRASDRRASAAGVIVEEEQRRNIQNQSQTRS